MASAASPAKKKKILLKVILLGDSQTGKTNILSQYCQKKFNRAYKATIGADFMVREVEVDGKLYTIQLWDTAGQERFASLGTAFYRGSDACIFVYDCNQLRSVEALQGLYDEFVNTCGTRDAAAFPFLLLGNKVDLGDSSAVNTAATKFHATQIGNGALFKCSALTNTGIDEAFIDLIRRVPTHDAIPSYTPIEEPITTSSPSPWATPASSGGWFSNFMAAGLEAKKKLDAKKAADAESSPATPSSSSSLSTSSIAASSAPSPPGGLAISTPSSAAKKSEPTFFQRHIMAGEEFTSFAPSPSSPNDVILRRVFIRYEPATDDTLPGIIHWKTIGDEGKEQRIVLDRDFGRAVILGKYHSIWQIEGAASGDPLNCFSIIDTSSTSSPSSSLHVVADTDDSATKWVVSLRDNYIRCKRIQANSYQSI